MQEQGQQADNRRRGGLGPKQQAWCDAHLPNLRRPRQPGDPAQPLLPRHERCPMLVMR
jgi:hypothetical protein